MRAALCVETGCSAEPREKNMDRQKRDRGNFAVGFKLALQNPKVHLPGCLEVAWGVTEGEEDISGYGFGSPINL